MSERLKARRDTESDPSLAAPRQRLPILVVVDDHPLNASIMMRKPNRLGYAVEIAENGLEGLRKWRAGRFSPVIADIA